MCYSKAQGGLRCESHVRKELVRLYQDAFAQAEQEARNSNYELMPSDKRSEEVVEAKKTYRTARQEEADAWQRIDDNAARVAALGNQPTADEREAYKDPTNGPVWGLLAFDRETPMLIESYYKSEDAVEKIRAIDEETSPTYLKEKLKNDLGNMLASLPTKRRKELNEIGRGRLLSKEALKNYHAALLEEAKSQGIETDPAVIRASRQDERNELQQEYKKHRAEFNKLSNHFASRGSLNVAEDTPKGQLPAEFMSSLETGRQTRHPLVMEELAHERLISECYFATQQREYADSQLHEAQWKEKQKPADRNLVQKYRQEVWSKTYDGMENQKRMNELKIQIAITPTRMKKLRQQLEDGKKAGKDMTQLEQKYNKLSSYRNNLMQKNILEAKMEEQEKTLL